MMNYVKKNVLGYLGGRGNYYAISPIKMINSSHISYNLSIFIDVEKCEFSSNFTFSKCHKHLKKSVKLPKSANILVSCANL